MKYILFFTHLWVSLFFTACGGEISSPPDTSKASDENISNLVLLDIHSVELNKTQSTKAQLLVTGTFSDETTTDLTSQATWNSSDISIATVDENGTVNALKTGTVTISAEKDDIVDTATITINDVDSIDDKLPPAIESIVETPIQIEDVVLSDEIQALLDVHNKAREDVGVTGKLTWSDKITLDAQSYADEMAQSGAWEHDSKNHGGYINGDYGENLYASTAKPTFAIAVQAWVDEKQFYTYGAVGDENTCVLGAQCGHYTQVIWEDTTEVGCAINQYKTGEYKDWYIVVCKYQTPGNYLNEKPYAIIP